MAEDVKSLSARLDAIEKLLSQAAQPTPISDISTEELRAYRKVRDIVAFDPDTVCGINECFKCVSVCRVCSVCVAVCRVCRVCDFECTCGPCNIGGRGGRFGGLGE